MSEVRGGTSVEVKDALVQEPVSPARKGGKGGRGKPQQKAAAEAAASGGGSGKAKPPRAKKARMG